MRTDPEGGERSQGPVRLDADFTKLNAETLIPEEGRRAIACIDLVFRITYQLRLNAPVDSSFQFLVRTSWRIAVSSALTVLLQQSS